MPYEMVQHEGQFCLRKKGETALVKGSCHKMKDETMAMMRALYANEKKSEDITMSEEFLIEYGSEIKSLPNGHIGGYLVRYSDANSPDLVGDFFTPETDFGFKDNLETPVYLNHRQPIKHASGGAILIKSKIGTAVLSKDSYGILIDAMIYERELHDRFLAKKNELKLGWSSGTAPHLVDRERVGSAYHVKTWPLGIDATITHKPCDSANVCSLKSHIESLKSFDGIEFEQDAEAIKAEAIKNDSLPLDAFPALRDCIVPSDLKGLDYRSEAVGAAVDELLTHWRMVTVAVKSYAAVLEDNARLRFERDGRPVSKKNQEWTAAAIQRFERLLIDHQEVTSYLREVQKSFDRTHLQERVLEEKVRFELARVAALTGYEPTDEGDK